MSEISPLPSDNEVIKEVRDWDIDRGNNDANFLLARAAFMLFAHEITDYSEYRALGAEEKWVNGYMAEQCENREAFGPNVSRVFIATKNNQVIGAMELMKSGVIDTPATYILRHVAVDSNHQKNGVGSRLLKHAEEVALTDDTKKITLSGENDVRKFYEENDYKITDLEYGAFDAEKQLS